MVENKSTYGRGTLKEFNEEYEKISCADRMKVNASQLFPTGQIDDDWMVFNWVIYYTVFPEPGTTETKTVTKTEEPKVELVMD